MELHTIFTIISAIIAFGSFLVSLTVLLVGRHVANKIMGNDLVHLSADVKEVIVKVDTFTKEMADIKIIVEKREAVCEERHKD